MQKKNSCRSGKLYLQISAFIIPLFLLTAAVIAFVVYNSTLKGFLESQNTNMNRQLLLAQLDIDTLPDENAVS